MKHMPAREQQRLTSFKGFAADGALITGVEVMEGFVLDLLPLPLGKRERGF